MAAPFVRHIFLYSMAFNYGVLMLWFLAFVLLHDPMYTLHRRWFGLSVESFDRVHYAGMSLYKIAILVLNVAPWVAMMASR